MLISRTAFDAYFTHASSSSKTSANVFSNILPPLNSEEYVDAISRSRHAVTIPDIWPEDALTATLARCFRELEEGFNLVFYGYGSKRSVINRFAAEYCAKAGSVVVANAFRPSFTLKDLVGSIENIPGISSMPVLSGGIDGQIKRIADFFAEPDQTHLYLVIHNIDGPALRAPRARACLALLARTPHVHLIASVDHIGAPLLWKSSELAARKEGGRGYAWLWHDLTTLVPYDAELAHADRSTISGAHSSGARATQDTAALSATVAMTETAAQHILASVTQKAKKLFMLMGNKQMDRMDEDAGAANVNANDQEPYAIGYDMLFTIARDNFVASNDTALRSLLGEFRDHGLVVGAAGVGGEVLWIPLRRERLVKVLQNLGEVP
ncbi:hypothetical protein PLICRDRAFT_52544 [Plicaturopsis crispa FD-325 SS-3]|nr:hypothetical protein PLICRDRAFT_52544 [Plicaturopsis crispa FD-325 SS-3]